MKKVIATICLGSLLVLIMSGCGGTGGTGTSGSSGSGLCTDESILSKLKNDDSPEFVLDGVYYALPISAEELIENGWTMTVDEYEGQEVILQPMERVKTSFTKDGNTFEAVLANDNQTEMEAEKSNVFRVECLDFNFNQPDALVTKYGITFVTSARDAKGVRKDKEGFEESSYGYKLISDGESGKREILFFNNNKDYASIRIHIPLGLCVKILHL